VLQGVLDRNEQATLDIAESARRSHVKPLLKRKTRARRSGLGKSGTLWRGLLSSSYRNKLFSDKGFRSDALPPLGGGSSFPLLWVGEGGAEGGRIGTWWEETCSKERGGHALMEKNRGRVTA